MMKASQINEILLQNHRGPSIIQTFCVGNLIVKKTFKQHVVNGFFLPFMSPIQISKVSFFLLLNNQLKALFLSCSSLHSAILMDQSINKI
jgi:hypothetical protein